MFALLSTLYVLTLAAICFGEQDNQDPWPADLTIALLNNTNQGCDISSAPAIHVYSFGRNSEVCIDIDTWTDASLGQNGTSQAIMNYTASNTQAFSSNASYTNIWFQQLRDNIASDPVENTVGILVLSTYPCSGCEISCSDEPNPAISGSASRVPLNEDQWLQWSCNAEGACYDLGYSMKSFAIRTAVDRTHSLADDTQNDKCQLAAATSSNATANNNTGLSGAGTALRGSLMGIWSTACLVLAFLFWI